MYQIWNVTVSFVSRLSMLDQFITDQFMTFAPKITIAWAPSFLWRFSRILGLVPVKPTRHLTGSGDIKLLELELIAKWNNQSTTNGADTCIHTLIEQQCAKQPTVEAVFTQHGSLTYAELNQLSNELAGKLRALGVQPETIVPICFEKSSWAIVAILAVLKAGGAFVLLDPSHPKSRLSDICSDVQASLIVTSSLNHSISSQACPHAQIMVIPEDKMSKEVTSPSLPHYMASLVPDPPSPDNAAYIAYTSGSTGRPKGIIVEHRSFVSSAIAHRDVQNLNSSSRVLQFASFGFDISIQEMLTPLIVGGTVCIPSDTQRLDNLATVIRQLKANWLELTPSVARLLSPKTVPDVKTLILGGESMHADDVLRWNGHLHLLVAYGPAECSVVSTVQPHVDVSDLYNIGRSHGGHCWVVNPNNHDQLQPLGSVGELLISGPIVARGYRNRPEQQSFIKSPRWAAWFGVSPRTRFYKTGDLVKYKIENGTLRFIGRKDLQVKVHGQRIELQEIEHCAQICSPGTIFVADVIRTNNKQLLTLFVQTGDNQSKVSMSDLQAWLSDRLAPFMVPTIYLPWKQFPLTATGKLDRRALLEQASIEIAKPSIPTQDSSLEGESNTELVAMLCDLFLEVLTLPNDQAVTHSRFYALGGNSLLAIELVAKARERGIHFSVVEILLHQTPARLALVSGKYEAENAIPTFKLVDDLPTAMEDAASQCQVPMTFIEDMYPCTPLQEGLVSMSSKQSGPPVGNYSFRLPKMVDLCRLEAAWRKVVMANPIYRTRIIQLGTGRLLQVVLKEPHDGKCDSMSLSAEILGNQLCSFSVIEHDDQADCPLFVARLHHALFDGWSYSLLLKDIAAEYNSAPEAPRTFFNQFAAYTSQLNAGSCKEFWSIEFQDLQASIFPTRPPAWMGPSLLSSKIRRMALSNTNADADGSTLANKIRLAWAVVMSSQTNSNDVVFGTTVSGRTAPVDGIERMAGPTIASYPLRIRLQPHMSIQEMLSEMQAHESRIIPFEHTGLQHICRASSEAAMACDFQTMLVIQPRSFLADGDLFEDSPQNQEQQRKFNSHFLTLVPQLERDTVDIEAVYDGSVLTSWDVESLLNQFESILGQIVCEPRTRIDCMRLHSESDSRQLLIWNERPPTEKTALCPIHEIIADVARQQPGVEAVCAWDGQLTYCELYELSLSLANHLQTMQSASTGSVVGLLMEKTKWFPVAVLGIMISGAAFVLLDPAFPTQRLQYILQTSNASIVICSSKTHARCVEIAEHAVLLKQDALSIQKQRNFWHQPLVAANDVMYVAFTSGSTGTPKGAIIEHGMAHSMLKAYQSLWSMKSTTRSLWFSSPAFDATILEVPLMLAAGGCLCIPSDEQRVNDLEGVMAAMRVNWTVLTPSVARNLSPLELPALRTLILAGESSLPSDLQMWFPHVKLHVSYGPAECSIAATNRRVRSLDVEATNIGQAPVASCWIVNPENHNQLQPLGAVGELVIGGPTVGRGYLNRPKENAAAFVQSPSWLTDFPSLRSIKLYKSGDLARFNQDGSLSYIGRKDTQVKINGQRIELQEIEQCAKLSLTEIEAVAEVVPLQHNLGSKLVLFICLLAGDIKLSLAEKQVGIFMPPTNEIMVQIEHLQKHLRQSLAPFMVPWLVVPLRYIPISPTGKTDRKLLKEQAHKLERKELDVYLGSGAPKRRATTKTEIQMQQIFSQVLSLPEDAIGIDDNFFAMGGDSISAMQILTLARKANLILTMPEFLVQNTIALFCENAQCHEEDTSLNDPEVIDDGVPFKLSPIQSMVFSSVALTEKRFNQSFLVRVKKTVDQTEWNRVLHEIVRHHGMLRARLIIESNGELRMKYESDIEGSLRISRHHLTRIEEVSDIAEHSQASLNLQKGPIFSFDLIHVPGEDVHALFMAHHMVVDLVSWRIILANVEELLQGRDLPIQGQVSFARWAQLQTTESQMYTASAEVLPFEVRPADYAYWQLLPEQNKFGDCQFQEFTIDEATTSQLLGQANVAWDSQPQDIFQAALLDSWRKVFTDHKMPTIFTEGHGREAGKHGIDPSQTVGWFTTLRPCTIGDESDSLGLRDMVRSVKDTCRSLPGNGLPYFNSRFLNPGLRSEFADHGPMEILLNYSGRYQQLERSDAAFSQASWQLDEKMDVGADMPRLALFDVVIDVRDGCLHVSVWYSRFTHRKSAISSWIKQYQQSLYDSAMVLSEIDSRLTLSDVPLVSFSYNELDTIQEKLRSDLSLSSNTLVENIHPCSDAHCGLIAGITGTAAHHRVRAIFEITAPGRLIEAAQIAEAWQELTRRHATLRSVLLDYPGKADKFLNIVLKSPPIDITTLPPLAPCYSSNSSPSALQQLRKVAPTLSWDTSPAQQLAICQASKDGTLFKLEFGKAFIDATSMAILVEELASMIAGHPLSPKKAPSYSSYISSLQTQDNSETMQYWTKTLSIHPPCLFPCIQKDTPHPSHLLSKKAIVQNKDSLDLFWRTHQLTLTNIFQVAWGLVLRHYTTSNEVSFGTILSGRDLPLPDIMQLVGSCFNVLPCCLRLDPSRALLDVFQENQRQMHQRANFQHCSLPEIIRSAGHEAGRFFNTCLTVQPVPDADLEATNDQEEIKIRLVEVHDPTEYDICIAVLLSPSQIEIDFRYWDSICTAEQASEIVALLSNTLAQITRSAEEIVGSVSMELCP
ncbi:nonribosomal peptide synthase [Penicillium antarcticum]|uniref:nonribosomal peptide synthase n=1 Tax=Penicillium antarcticum TaxID=416450 RepID=UPI00239773B8|nr:nonribosomal peptide synthase [Penicillium antarcticum]KAJ5301395.1 nonribosomal peptide synthase [Penicillium antarcticum]